MSRFDAALDPKMAVDRPVASSPTEAQEVLRARPRDRRPASDALRWQRRQGGGNLPRCAVAPRSPSRPQPRSASRRCALGNGVRAATFRREVPPTGRRRRAPVGRGARLEGLRQPSAPHRSSRAAPRSRLHSATRRLAPRRPTRPLSTNRSPGTPLARSVFGLSARGRPFRAQFLAAARRTGPVGAQRRALRLSGTPAA